jgi:hypothetical protein
MGYIKIGYHLSTNRLVKEGMSFLFDHFIAANGPGKKT